MARDAGATTVGRLRGHRRSRVATGGGRRVSAIETRGDVDAVLEDFFAARIARAADVGSAHEALWRRAAESSRGGKRLRPLLVRSAHDAYGGSEPADAVLIAAAFEVMHTALLLHDDVLDGDLVRRGRPNLAGRFAEDALGAGVAPRASTAWGTGSALLAGDLLLSATHALVARVRADTRGRIHEIVDDCLDLTAAGEHADIGLALGTLAAAPEEILRMMARKTAAYSFSAPLRAGAVLAGAGDDALAALDEIGTDMGILFQLRDDMLGVFGTVARTGKTATGDLREGKRTLLVAHAEGHPAWEAVAHLFGRRGLDDNDAARLREALVASGAAADMERFIADRHERIRARIADAALPAALARDLTRLARHSVERDA
nr:polyprenyl synthetase family protein [Microbacterium sp. ZXX196]